MSIYKDFYEPSPDIDYKRIYDELNQKSNMIRRKRRLGLDCTQEIIELKKYVDNNNVSYDMNEWWLQ